MKFLILFLGLSCQIMAQHKKLPIVFIHGFLASGDTWSTQYQRFLYNGYTRSQLQVFDWNTLGGKNQGMLLELFIDSILKINKASQINLIGHSAGGGLAYTYCNKSENAKKVAHYIHIASGLLKKPAGPNAEIPTAILYSSDDFIATGAGKTEGATTMLLEGKDHYEVATSEISFEKMFQFLHQKKPKLPPANFKGTKTIHCRNLFFGTNEVLPNSTVEVQQYDPAKGTFTGTANTLVSNSLGWWDLKVKSREQAPYVFSFQPNESIRKVFYFFEPFKGNKLVSLRVFNKGNSLSTLLNQLPNDSTQPVICIFTSNSATIAGRDSLAINEMPLSGNKLTPAKNTTIATFIYDKEDKISSGRKIPAFQGMPFINGVDYFADARVQTFFTLYYNGRTMKIPVIPSYKGITVVVLD